MMRKTKKDNPILPSTFRALGWNAGQVDCRHYCSQLGFCVTAIGDRSQPMVDVQAFNMQDGGYSREESGRPLSHICPGPCAVFSCRCQRGYCWHRLAPIVPTGNRYLLSWNRGTKTRMGFTIGMYGVIKHYKYQ